MKLSVLQMVWAVILILGGAVGAGWGAQVYLQGTYATRESVQIAGGKADILMDARIEALIKQRDDVQRKPKKAAEDLRDLDYLEKQIDYLRKVQRGQIK